MPPTAISSPSSRRSLGDAGAVDPGAVGGAEVDDHEAVALAADLGVAPAHVGVGAGCTSHSGRRPMRHRLARRADAGCRRAGPGCPPPPPPGASMQRAGHERTRRCRSSVVGVELDLDRPHEAVALVPGVLPGGVGQLADEGLGDVCELLVVVGARAMVKWLGDDAARARRPCGGRPSPGPGAGRARPAAAPLRKAWRTRPRPGARAAARTACSPIAGPSIPRPSRLGHAAVGASATVLDLHSGEWRNWQTRRIQVPVSERTWGFKSPLAHHKGAGQRGCGDPETGRLLPDFYRTARQPNRSLRQPVAFILAQARGVRVSKHHRC